MFLFSFYQEDDRTRLMKQGPWFFEIKILVLQAPVNRVQPSEMELKWVPFWLHLLLDRWQSRGINPGKFYLFLFFFFFFFYLLKKINDFKKTHFHFYLKSG